ncbi:hypothetical protein AB9F46_27555 [Rhizobium leguminosarum]|uniref:hypothetical protein n=1 Tax=Rhizobium leguminosarum TaxID=384 RepID=UPI003F958055
MRKVPVDVAEDDSSYGGYAFVTLRTAIPEGPVRLQVFSKVATDKPYLGKVGWQAGSTGVDVELVSRAPDKTVLRVGPSICDNIGFSTPVKLSIEGSDVYGDLYWPSIAVTPKNWGGGSIGGGPGDIKDPPPKPAEVSLDKPKEETPPEITFPKFPETKVEETAPKIPVLKKKSRAGLYLLLLLLAVGLAGGGMYAYQWKKTHRDAPEETHVTPTVPVESMADKLARLKRDDRTGDQLLALNDEAFQAGDRAVAQQAIDAAIELNNESAKLRVARWYDPGSFDPQRVQSKDANKAARTYFELGMGGNREARTRLAAICQAGRGGGADYQGFFETTYCQGSLDP